MRWKIENISHFLWLKKGEAIQSPAFVVEAWEDTKWSLSFYPMACLDENYVGCYLKREEDCGGPDKFEVNFQLAFLCKDGSILKESNPVKHKFIKNEGWGFLKYERRERVFVTERETFLPEDTLTVQCNMWVIDEKPDKSNHLFATTSFKVKRRSFVWKIDKPSTLKSGIRNKFTDNLIDFDLVINEGFDSLNINVTSFDETIKYISCNTSVIDSEGRKENYGSKIYFPCDLKKGVLSFMLLFPEMLMENKSRYFPNDVLSLDFEFVLAAVEHFGCRLKYPKLENDVVGTEKCRNTAVPVDDFKSLYNDGIFSDTEIRTTTKTFPVHKGVLSVRSPVFRSMFSHDMKEKNSGHVDITDFEDDTVHRMLLYIYTDSLEDLQFESASKLYTIADKYQIPALKISCSSFLKENLCPKNACDALVLADLHNDDDLKSSVRDYILRQRKQVFCSEEWKDFMNTHLKLAADLMYTKITNSKMYLPRKRPFRPTGGTMRMRMRSRWINKRGLASLVGTIMVGALLLPVIVRAFYGRGRAMAVDDHYDSGLSTRTVAATVIQMCRTG
ncbi:TD and POZ domain-containing protein 2 [Araneus ventricosus]|uniref:TD and POZ domain-containing protein 2 n=1 Tax=Araneus ventricosus TaxID=182803 RepID=A0A4Y2CZ53_ARAVE|nr:TD and POZ domain-containing protein 2 [Araneus ventricosus]